MAEKLFGTDGFRGPVDKSGQLGLVNYNTFNQIAREYAALVHEETGQPGVFVVGTDTRTSRVELNQAVCEGLSNAGAEVWDLGIAPTPVIAWTAKEHNTHAVSITASHNEATDNGIKLFDIGGSKMSAAKLGELEERYSLGRSRALSENGQWLFKEYLIDDYLKNTIAVLGGPDILEGYSLVVDGANGAAYDLAPALYRALGAQVIEVACEPDGNLINKDCGAAHLEKTAEFLGRNPDLTASDMFLGVFANDGDADRVMGLDSQGRIVDGNYWLKRLAIGQVGIVGTIYTNSALRLAVEDMGVEFHECPNGDHHVTSKLRELSSQRGEGFTRGGEFTGHMVDTSHLPSGDGLYMGAWLASRLVQEGATLADLKDELELWPQQMVNISTNGKKAEEIMEKPAVTESIESAKDSLGDSGRLIIRPSGTEPLIRVWAETSDQETLNEVIGQLWSAFTDDNL